MKLISVILKIENRKDLRFCIDVNRDLHPLEIYEIAEAFYPEYLNLIIEDPKVYEDGSYEYPETEIGYKIEFKHGAYALCYSR